MVGAGTGTLTGEVLGTGAAWDEGLGVAAPSPADVVGAGTGAGAPVGATDGAGAGAGAGAAPPVEPPL